MNRLTFRDAFNADLELIVQAGNIGLLVAYVMSWIVSNKRNWHWINSVVIFVVAFSLKNFLLNSFLDKIFLTPGRPFKIYSWTGHLLLGLGLVAAGLFIFFFKSIIRFIDAGNRASKKDAPKGTPAAAKHRQAR